MGEEAKEVKVSANRCDRDEEHKAATMNHMDVVASMEKDSHG
jgi:hypothetical protein